MDRQGTAGPGPRGRVGLLHQMPAGAHVQKERRRVLGSPPPRPVRLDPVDADTGVPGRGEHRADAVGVGQGVTGGPGGPDPRPRVRRLVAALVR
ncbi:hypothetical protein [Streptomyces alfalfae]|uniref:Uncharacterized protein n=1 Tax=Streptomyces alfalfae TaxID=1642299 RepID=A0A7T4PC73_9ACTN|nr:hypothetical protein I8755_02810 [Streptomyces alfalfae]